MPLNTEVIAKLDSDLVISETDPWLTLSAGDFNEGGVQKYMQLRIYLNITAKFPFLNEDAKREMTERLYRSAVTKLYENAQGITLDGGGGGDGEYTDQQLIVLYPYRPALILNVESTGFEKGYYDTDDPDNKISGAPPRWSAPSPEVTFALEDGFPDFLAQSSARSTSAEFSYLRDSSLRYKGTWEIGNSNSIKYVELDGAPSYPPVEDGDSDTSQTIDLSISLDQLSSELGNLQNTLPSIPGGNNVGGNITEYGDDRITNVTNVTNVVNNVTSVTNVVNVVDGAAGTADAATSPSVLGSSAGANAPQAPGFGDADFSGLGGSLNRDW